MGKLGLGGLLVVLVAGAYLWVSGPETPLGDPPAAALAPVVGEAPEAAEPAELSTASTAVPRAAIDARAARPRVSSEPVPGASEPAVPDPRPTIVVELLDADGSSVPDGILRVEGRRRPAGEERGPFNVHDARVELEGLQADDQGRVEVALDAGDVERLLLRAEAPGFVPLSRLVSRDELEEPLTLVLLQGPFVAGRALDSDGEPVLAFSYKLRPEGVDPDRQRSGWASSDRDGRFAAPATEAGAHVFHAWSDEVGRSEDIDLVLRPAGGHDLGDLVLRGEGRLGGTLLLGDGSALTRSSVTATLVGAPAGVGLHRATAKADASGAFLIERLAPGRYELTNGWDDSLPILNPGPYSTGELELTLLVDAHQIRVEARNDLDEVVLIGKLRRAWVAKYGTSSASRAFPEPVESSEFPATAGVETRVTATGVDGERYLGVVPDSWSSGSYELVLRPSVESLARLVVRATSEALLADAALSLTGLTGADVSEFGPPQAATSGPEGGRLELVVDGLDPGTVELAFKLRSEGYLGLARKTYTVDLVGGETTVLDLSLVVGGRISIELESGESAGEGRRGARVAVLRPGEPEWQGIALETKEYDDTGAVIGWSFGGVAFFDDEPAVSEPLPAGVYSIRVEEEAHLPYEQTVEVRAGETTELTVRLTSK